mmetsp:Transcript_47669/g.134313  ORF Transcript_47669/g.134313 Transcript_47669/m.134313 type:complete len:97 (-) Transcript_47669:95-385(-)
MFSTKFLTHARMQTPKQWKTQQRHFARRTGRFSMALLLVLVLVVVDKLLPWLMLPEAPRFSLVTTWAAALEIPWREDRKRSHPFQDPLDLQQDEGN